MSACEIEIANIEIEITAKRYWIVAKVFSEAAGLFIWGIKILGIRKRETMEGIMKDVWLLVISGSLRTEVMCVCEEAARRRWIAW